MNKLIVACFICLMALASCRNNPVRISGTLDNPLRDKYIYLDELHPENLITVDSSKISGDGKFSFKREIENSAFYMLKINDRNQLLMLLQPGEKIELAAHFDSLEYPHSVSGSKGTEQMHRYNLRLKKTIDQMNDLGRIYRENKDNNNPDLPVLIESLDSLANTYYNEINAYTKNYIDSNLTSLVSLIALYEQVAPGVYVLDPSDDFSYFLKVDSALSLLYPDYEPVKALHGQVQEQMAALDMKKEVNGLVPGAVAPEIMLPSPEGDTIRLSSTRGSIVLLDFWASWCTPCRKENPNLVMAYNLYHKKGFRIFQISLDKTKEAWIKGIEDDQLGRWIHVSDIQYWNSKVVALYRIESIPSNFLLDKEGKIIAMNLRGEALQTKLAELFK